MKLTLAPITEIGGPTAKNNSDMIYLIHDGVIHGLVHVDAFWGKTPICGTYEALRAGKTVTLECVPCNIS